MAIAADHQGERDRQMTEDLGPRVSFVIPNYQGEGLLPACLGSIYSQETDAPYEIIMVDDCSSDGSAALISRRYPEVRLVVNRRNRGCAASKNIGAAQARGEYIAFLDNDVELDPRWLEAMVGRFEREGDGLGVCASHILVNGYSSLLNSTGGLINLLGYAWDRGIFGRDTDSYSRNTQVMWACAAAMIVRRSIFEEVGGFDSAYEYLFDDVDLGWRMNIFGYHVAYEPRAIAFHHQNTVQGWKLVRRLQLYERNRLRNLLKNMQGETLRWIRGELVHNFLHRVRRELDNGNLSLLMRLSLVPRMVQALLWNAVHLRDTLRLKREVEARRKLTDRQLMDRGVLCPFLGDPYIMEDPRLERPLDRPPGRLKDLGGKVLMSSDMDGSLGPGWHAREVDARGAYFRWTDSRAVVRLRVKKGKRCLILHSVMAHPEGASQASIRVNGRLISTFEIPNRPHRQKIELPPHLQPGDWEVEVAVANPFTPLEVLGIEDHRRLGVAVTRIEAR